MVHAEIAAVVNPLKILLQSKYSNRDNRCEINVTELLNLENKTTEEHCPKCNATDSDERNGLCWNFICGRCRYGKHCRHVHARPDRLPQAVINGFLEVIAAPIAKKMEEIRGLPDRKKAKTAEAEVRIS